MSIKSICSNRKAFLFILFSFAVLSSQLTASAQTFSRTNYPILGNNHITADLNGDGVLDLAATGSVGIGVMLGNGDGTFRPRVNYTAGAQSQDLAVGDFNSDGRTDVVVSLISQEFSLALLTGNGDGTFNAPVLFDNTAAQDDSPAIVATDLDNDGRLDVVLAHMLSCFVSPCVAARTITVMLGFGDGTFQTPFEIDVGTGMSRIAVGDFNSDGIKDLGIAGDQAQVYVLLGIGNGSFLKQPTINLLTTGTIGVDGTDIDVADLNGDTIQDLVVAIALNGSRTAIMLGNNDGTFQPAQIITEPRLRVPQYQVIADFNRDGFLDLALSLANGTEGLLEIRRGNGDGTFGAPQLYFAPPPNSSIGGGPLVTG
ncbi:MAG TPA: VCBS repeat-containing protein, partial [Pyrinomonadaceae bacterium]|nr:VCBS repeat-containing protein [Pyrinomonadaceae bacterium]